MQFNIATMYFYNFPDPITGSAGLTYCHWHKDKTKAFIPSPFIVRRALTSRIRYQQFKNCRSNAIFLTIIVQSIVRVQNYPIVCSSNRRKKLVFGCGVALYIVKVWRFLYFCIALLSWKSSIWLGLVAGGTFK